MGSLTLPTSGSVYLDAQIFIYSVEKHPVYAPLLRPMWQAVQVGSIEAVTSELCLLETLVIPYRRNDTALTNDYEQLFRQPGVRLVEISGTVLREAARIRAAAPSVRTPDAIHAATARHSGCALLITNDSGFGRIPGLPLTILADIVGP